MFQKDGVRSNALSWVSSIYILDIFRSMYSNNKCGIKILKLKWKNQCKPRKIASSKHHHIQSLFLLKETFGVSLFLQLCYLPYIQYAINLPIHKSRIDFRRCISCWQCILCLFNKKSVKNWDKYSCQLSSLKMLLYNIKKLS